MIEFNKKKTSYLEKIAKLLEEATTEKDSSKVNYVTTKTACAIAHISRWTVHNWIKKGNIRAIKLGSAQSSRVMIDEASLYAYLSSMVINTKTTKGGEAK